jgi:hypothetical protein
VDCGHIFCGQQSNSGEAMTLKSPGKKTRQGYQTQWAAQFAVASELCKRNYEVSFTMGNTTPVADLMVVSPARREMFLIDVKGLYRPNPWVIKRKAVRANLFYVLAFVPADGPNEFFIMTQQQVGELIQAELKRLNRPDDYPMTDLLWKQAFEYRNAWDVLPR